MDTYVIFHMLPRCFQNVIFKVIITFKVMKMTIELKKASPFHIILYLHKDVWLTEFFFEKKGTWMYMYIIKVYIIVHVRIYAFK